MLALLEGSECGGRSTGSAAGSVVISSDRRLDADGMVATAPDQGDTRSRSAAAARAAPGSWPNSAIRDQMRYSSQ